MLGYKVSEEEFLRLANEFHSEKYDYSEVKYVSFGIKVNIICPKHGVFSQTPVSHLRGGCSKCGVASSKLKQTKTTVTFIKNVTAVHGDRYDYSKVRYKKSTSKIEIVCKEHGSFMQIASNHLSGAGCPSCANAARLLSTQMFVDRAISVHGTDKYEYNQVSYVDSKTPVTVFCKVHAKPFSIMPIYHVSMGGGCPLCATGGFKKHVMSIVYILKSSNMVKIGITNKPISIRLSKINSSSPEIFSVIYVKEMLGESAVWVEKMVLSAARSLTSTHVLPKFDGFTECFWRKEVNEDILINLLDEKISEEVLRNV